MTTNATLHYTHAHSHMKPVVAYRCKLCKTSVVRMYDTALVDSSNMY